jgi:hypothetical protein
METQHEVDRADRVVIVIAGCALVVVHAIIAAIILISR